jgi:exodeoxyribonuclease V alpha subunit
MPDLADPRQISFDPSQSRRSSTSVEGVVETIIFRNKTNGYSVIALSGDSDVVAVGILPYLSEGESVRLFGGWAEHPDYGFQFQVEHYEVVAPNSSESILQYLKSGIIKGIGEKTAEKLVGEFGDETLNILRDHPERVKKIKGIGAKKARRISEQILEKQEYQGLVLYLSPLGIGLGKILRIYRQFGAQALSLVLENPYRLADEIYGIGFSTADALAQKMGLDPKSPHRVVSALKYLLHQAAAQGHTCLPLGQLLAGASKLLQDTITADHPAVAVLLEDPQVKRVEDADAPSPIIALSSLYHSEKAAAERLRVLIESAPSRFGDLMRTAEADQLIQRNARDIGMTLAPEQQKALLSALQNQVLVLTGGPGTGKTTITRLLCSCLNSLGGKVLLAAPTGRAARRMTEATGVQARTLHRLLEIQYVPDENRMDYQAGLKPKAMLSCDLLIVDEASMIDAVLFRSLLDAIVPGTRLVLIGDADQLPSVGPGYVLKDLIDSGRIPTVRLTQVFRQSNQSLIIRNAHRIHAGHLPELDQTFDSQFLWIVKESAEAVAQAVVKLYREILPEKYGLDPLRDVQVLTPSRKGAAGTGQLNQQLQQAMQQASSDQDSGIHAHGSRFLPGDKVMQIRNSYDMSWIIQSDPAKTGSGVFNGETGTILSVEPEENTLEALFDDDRLILYDQATLEDLDLAYAITIHKSQGSEYPVVILAVPPGAPQLLTRNLLYTAVTRAWQKLLLVASRRTIAGMVANDRAYTRHTLLKGFLSTPN